MTTEYKPLSDKEIAEFHARIAKPIPTVIIGAPRLAEVITDVRENLPRLLATIEADRKRIAELEKELFNIASASPYNRDKFVDFEEFCRWARNRATHVLQAQAE
jgi:folylpolyglutamate synthase/dihydropteroate synthase